MILHLFTLLFTGLKLANIINWSWWLILLPSYGIFAVGVFLWIIGKTAGLVLHMIETPEEKNRRQLSESLKELSKRIKA